MIKRIFEACRPGLSILALQLGCYLLLNYVGLPPIFATPMVNKLFNWILWDPAVIMFRLHDMGLSVLSAVYTVYQKDWDGLKDLVKSQLSVAAVTVFLKKFVARLRPDGSDFYSFPSGHSSSAFMAASYVHHRYGLEKAVPAYMCASVIGCVRVHKLAHFPSDVFAGAGIGILLAYNLVREKSKNPAEAIVEPPTPAPSPIERKQSGSAFGALL